MSESFTMRPKTNDMIGNHLSYKETPGPGQYESIELDPKSGRFMVSKFNDSKFGKVTDSGPRFSKVKETPGPSSYIELDGLSPRGKYISSKRSGNGTIVFNQTARSHFTDEFSRTKKNPGPGDYENPSEFGVYGDSKYYKTLGSFKSTIG